MKYHFISSFLLSCVCLSSYASEPAKAAGQWPYNQTCSITYSFNGSLIFHGIGCSSAKAVLQRIATENSAEKIVKQFQICLKHRNNGAKQCYSPTTGITCAAAVQEIEKVQAVTVKED